MLKFKDRIDECLSCSLGATTTLNTDSHYGDQTIPSSLSVIWIELEKYIDCVHEFVLNSGMCIKSQSHCSDNKNNYNHNTKKTHSIG